MPDAFAQTTPQLVMEVAEQSTRMAHLFGLGVVLAIFITIAFIGLVWISITHARDRDRGYMTLINTTIKQMNDAILAHDVRAIEAVKSLAQANEYQRQEHKEIINLIREARFHSSA